MSSGQGVDARAYLSGWATMMSGMCHKDIMAIPEEKWQATFGGCSKSPADVTADVIGLLVWTTEALRGNVSASDEDYLSGQVKQDCATRDGACAKLGSITQAFTAALTEASDESLNATVMAPWGMPAPLFVLAQVAASHIWYHDGQLNYIQSLLGDGAVHWMDA